MKQLVNEKEVITDKVHLVPPINCKFHCIMAISVYGLTLWNQQKPERRTCNLYFINNESLLIWTKAQ